MELEKTELIKLDIPKRNISFGIKSSTPVTETQLILLKLINQILKKG